MPAPVPTEKRRDVPVLTRLTRAETRALRKAAAKQRVTVAALIRESLTETGHLPTVTR